MLYFKMKRFLLYITFSSGLSYSTAYNFWIFVIEASCLQVWNVSSGLSYSTAYNFWIFVIEASCLQVWNGH